MSITKLPNKILLTNLAFLLVALIWGAAGPIIKYTMNYIPPFTLLFLRFLVVCVVLLPYMIVRLMGTKVAAKDYWNLFLLGVFAQTALGLAFVGLELTNALDATIIGIIAGILTVYAGHYFYHEKVNRKITVGLILASIGTLVVILEPIIVGSDSTSSVGNRILGNVLTMIYNVTWVIYVIWSKMSMGQSSTLLKKTLSFIHIKPMSKPYPPELISAITMYVGLLTFSPMAILENIGFAKESSFRIVDIDPRGIMGLLYLALLSSIVAYLLYQWALEYGRITDSTIFGYLTPIFAFPVAYWLLKEVPNTSLLVGAGIIALGVIVAEFGAAETRRRANKT